MARRGKGEGNIRLRPDGRWEARYTVDAGGQRKRRSVFGKTRAEAAKKLRDSLNKAEHNLPIPNERETVGLFLDSWMEHASSALRPRTQASYRMIITRHLKPDLGNLKLVKLGPEAIRDYMGKKRASGLSARTVQYHHAVLRAALGQAEADGKIIRNPARLKSARPAPVERREVRPLSPDQARVLLGAIAEQRLSALYATAIALGLRQGELLGLTWDDVDLEAGTLTVRRTLQRYGRAYHLDAPKTEKSRRTLGLPATLVQLFRAHRQQQVAERLRAGPAWQGEKWNLIFCNEAGSPLSGNNITHQFQALLASLGLPRQRFHDLRHAAATFMLAQGVDLRVVMEVLGHSQIHVTANTYTHVKLDLSREAAERVDALLSSR